MSGVPPKFLFALSCVSHSCDWGGEKPGTYPGGDLGRMAAFSKGRAGMWKLGLVSNPEAKVPVRCPGLEGPGLRMLDPGSPTVQLGAPVVAGNILRWKPHSPDWDMNPPSFN